MNAVIWDLPPSSLRLDEKTDRQATPQSFARLACYRTTRSEWMLQSGDSKSFDGEVLR